MSANGGLKPRYRRINVSRAIPKALASLFQLKLPSRHLRDNVGDRPTATGCKFAEIANRVFPTNLDGSHHDGKCLS
nr:hypothetical protein [Phenylobacterium sp.]